jgi:type III secretion protein D
MSEAQVLNAVDAACELRVLDGRARGAKASLERRRWTEVGYGLASDLVIRDPAAKDLRLRLRPRDDAAELDLIQGEVELLGHRLTAPASAILPAYVPLILGGSAVAFGDAASIRWSDAERLLVATRVDEAVAEGEPIVEPTEAADAPLPAWQVISPALTQASRFKAALPIMGGALAAVALATLGWSGVSAWLNSAPSPERAQAILAKDGFAGLKVEPTDTGLVAKGLLSHGPDLTRLKADVARRGWPLALSVQTNDQLRAGVADVLRTNGYQANIHALGPGLLVAQISGGDPTRLEDARREALRDNPGLKQLVIQGEGAGQSPPALAPNDPNKRVIAVVGGELGYIQTADGSRYFVGATLPSGHKITQIDDQVVQVEMNGKITHLTF